MSQALGLAAQMEVVLHQAPSDYPIPDIDLPTYDGDCELQAGIRNTKARCTVCYRTRTARRLHTCGDMLCETRACKGCGGWEKCPWCRNTLAVIAPMATTTRLNARTAIGQRLPRCEAWANELRGQRPRPELSGQLVPGALSSSGAVKTAIETRTQHGCRTAPPARIVRTIGAGGAVLELGGEDCNRDSHPARVQDEGKCLQPSLLRIC